MVSDYTLHPIFKELTFAQFWYSFKEKGLQLSGKAIKILLPFPTTYLFEVQLPSYISAKTAYQNRFNKEADLRTQQLR